MALNMNNSRETRVRELLIPANSRYTRLLAQLIENVPKLIEQKLEIVKMVIYL